MKFSEACEEVVKEAERHNKVAYLYQNRIGNFRWGVSHQYWNDWLFKAYPGGRRELSVEGTKLAQSESSLTMRGADVLVRCVECGALLETDVHCDNCGSFHPTRGSR